MVLRGRPRGRVGRRRGIIREPRTRSWAFLFWGRTLPGRLSAFEACTGKLHLRLNSAGNDFFPEEKGGRDVEFQVVAIADLDRALRSAGRRDGRVFLSAGGDRRQSGARSRQ